VRRFSDKPTQRHAAAAAPECVAIAELRRDAHRQALALHDGDGAGWSWFRGRHALTMRERMIEARLVEALSDEIQALDSSPPLDSNPPLDSPLVDFAPEALIEPRQKPLAMLRAVQGTRSAGPQRFSGCSAKRAATSGVANGSSFHHSAPSNDVRRIFAPDGSYAQPSDR
jgi:hypothetical protein